MYRITNTADDRKKHLQHRTAPQFELEPNLGGHRIRLGTYYDITPEHYERVKPVIDAWVKKGMVEVMLVGPHGEDLRKFVKEPEYNSDGLKLGGPTLEQWLDCGYSAEKYPPEGFAEVFSPGLVAYKRALEEEATEIKIADIPGPSRRLDISPEETEKLLSDRPPVLLAADSAPPVAEPPIPEQPAPAPIPVQAAVVPPPPLAPTVSASKGKKTLR